MDIKINTYRIMIVDDDTSLLDMLEIILQRDGYTVLQADGGFKALQLAAEQKPDLIIIDMMMPDLDGIDTVRQLRAMPAIRNTPVIMLSALGTSKDKIRGLEAGVDDYVAKPTEPKELMLRVKVVLSRANLTITRTIAVIGAKGGVGTSTVAANTAIALTQQGKSTVLMDMRPHNGVLHYHFKLSSDNTTHRLLKTDPAAIKRQEIQHAIVTHKSGLRLLLPPTTYHQDTLTPKHVEAILEGLSTNANYIILDLPASPNPAVRRALELSDQVLLVTGPDTLSVLCAQRQVEYLKAWNVYSRTDAIIVNRVRTGVSALSQIEIEIRLGMRSEEERGYNWEQETDVNGKTFRQGVISTIPSAPEILHEAVKEQVPYVLIEPGAHASHAMLDIGDWIMKKHD